MSEMETPSPETEDDGLHDSPADVDALGGDAEILDSLPVSPESAIEAEADSEPTDDSADEPVVAAEDSPFLTFRVEEEIVDDYEADADPYAEMVDIDAALAAVSSLSDAQAQREAIESAQAADAERQLEPEPELELRPLGPLKAPPPVTLRRGQLASVIPALALMGAGAWLTLSLTSGVGALTSPVLVLGVLGAVLVLILLAQWLGSGRWTRGVLFVAVLALLLVGALYYDMVAGLGLALPLALVALGGAFVLTGLLGRPPDRRLLVPGLLVAAAGVLAAVIARGLLPGALLAEVAPYWWVVAAVVVVIWLLPVVFGRRRG